MIPARLLQVLALLQISERGLARMSGYSPGAVRNWVSGAAAVPNELARWLDAAAVWRDQNPPPQKTRPSVNRGG